ncbi:hypothetical protein C8R44DRAFT_138657 [Mycena epipterygia]|nr:hypothetical protein C8R44DRAFT_138657 [Mycena epipterygia]
MSCPAQAGAIFRERFNQYIQNLEPSDSAWLKTLTETSWEPVVMELEALNQGHKDSSATRKLLSRVRCFIDALRPFFACIDTIVSSNLQVVGLVWGALKLVIELTHKFTEYFSVIGDTLETISVELPIFQDYVEILYPESNAVQKAVVVVFEDIISVFILVRRVFVDSKGHTRSLFGISLKLFRQNMEGITEHLEKHRKSVQVHVQHAERLVSKDERAKAAQGRKHLEAKILSDERRASEITFYARIEKFQALLNAPHCWEKHEASLQIYKQPECWLLNTPQYKEWCKNKYGFLWCHAKPGAGKTVLSSVIIDNLLQKHHGNPEVAVVFFYCEYDDPMKRTANKIVASILDQLMYNPKVLALVKDNWMNDSPNLQHLGLSNLQDLIIQLLQQSQHTCIVVDALDECDTPDDMANILSTLAIHCSVLVTSRSECEDISVILRQHPQISISSDSIQLDIEFFVASSLERHRRLSKQPTDIKQQISKVLLSAADGMFLWVTLMIEMLGNQISNHEVLVALSQLPIGLTATYFRILTGIDQLPSRKWCMRAITWLLCAQRPLELSELMSGIAVDDMDKSGGWDMNRIPDNPSDVLFDCKGLISCTQTPHGIMVQFTHTSVRDFLSMNPLEVVSTVPEYHIFPD